MTLPRFSVIFALVQVLFSQSADKPFTGKDGFLSLTTPGIVEFDPQTIAHTQGTAYEFSSIIIGKGVTVKLTARMAAGPIIWLSPGPVVIEGSIDLDGEAGDSGSRPVFAGSGGFAGGAQGKPGYGPVDFKPNQYLIPLVGGLGGAGGSNCTGGSGGGALLIASESSITIRGSIHANGGKAIGACIPGGGGAIRLVAPTIDGDGTLSAQSGGNGALDGRIRLETMANYFTGESETPATVGKPLGLFLPPEPTPSVQVISINNQPVEAKYVDTLRRRAVPLSRIGPSQLAIEAHFVPPGTVIELEIYSGIAEPRVIQLPALKGTFETSRAETTIDFAKGASSVYVKANWDRAIK